MKIYLIIFSFLFLSKSLLSLERNCDQVVQKNRNFFIKYTFIKYDGLCFLYGKDMKKISEMNFKNGKKEGRFINYEDGLVVDRFFMKNNKLHGIFEKFKKGELYKKIWYKNGKKLKCSVKLDYIMSLEKELLTIKSQTKILEMNQQRLNLIQNTLKPLTYKLFHRFSLIFIIFIDFSLMVNDI